MNSDLVIWGAGGHAKVVLDTARAVGYTSIRLVDDAAPIGSELFGYTISRPQNSASHSNSSISFIIAVGDCRARALCFARSLELGWTPATLIHPSAVVSPACEISPGSVVLPQAVINAGSIIGRNCIINTGAIIEHDCRLSDHVHIAPSATLGGNVTVGSFAFVGTGASVLPGCEIGEGSVVGAGAVVVKSTPRGVTVMGVPAQARGELRVINPSITMGPPMSRILLSVPHMGGFEEHYIAEAFASNWLSTVGPNISAFEEEFGARLGLSAVAVSSGTAAIHLGLRALGVGSSDTVFCSDLTFVASVNPILYLGAEPVLIDSNRESWNMDPLLLGRALAAAAAQNRLPAAVVVVHLFGQCADMDPILELCARYGVPVLEDAAEALGATYKGRPAGTLGNIAAFSFNGNKIITTTGGGMLVSKNPGLVAKAQFWAAQARDSGVAYSHSELGYNYRLSNVLAGIGRGQLRLLDLRVQQRRSIALRYANAFADLPGISFMPQASYGLHTNWLSCFLIDQESFGCSRDDVMQHLEKAGVESRPIWKPMHMQDLYASARRYEGDVAEDLFRRGICLPSSSSLSIEDQLYVIEQVRKVSSRGSLLRLAGQAGASRESRNLPEPVPANESPNFSE